MSRPGQEQVDCSAQQKAVRRVHGFMEGGIMTETYEPIDVGISVPSVNYFFPLATITLPHRVDVLTAFTSSSP
jgi:hypothetical protein